MKRFFLCARFVAHAINSDPDASETLARIASIGLLTEVVQDFVKPNTPVETSNLIVYLDAPVAMELLGVSGRAARENIEPAVAELKRIGASVRIFGQSVEEIKRNLRAVLGNQRPTGPTAQALAKGEVLIEYATEVAADPEKFLEQLGIRVAYRKLEQNPAEHAYFTGEQRDEIYGALIFQQNLNARNHDTDVTTLIVRQRGGHEDRDIFRSRFLLMTRNGLLAQLVRRKCVELGVMSPKSIPPVVHRRVLTATMWLRTGLRAGDLEVPKRLLLANCERVLAIRPNVVDHVKRLTDALGDEEKVRQLDVLVKEHRSAQMLMDKTLGAPSVVNESNVGELLTEMLHPYIEEERQKSDKALRDATEAGEKKVGKVRVELEEAKRAGDVATTQLGEMSAEDESAIQALCREISRKLAIRRRIWKGVAGTVAVMLCSPPLFASFGWQGYLSIVLGAPLAYMTITGSKRIGTATSEEYAMKTLLRMAEERGLKAKVSRFVIKWQGNRFEIIGKVDKN